MKFIKKMNDKNIILHNNFKLKEDFIKISSIISSIINGYFNNLTEGRKRFLLKLIYKPQKYYERLILKNLLHEQKFIDEFISKGYLIMHNGIIYATTKFLEIKDLKNYFIKSNLSILKPYCNKCENELIYGKINSINYYRLTGSHLFFCSLCNKNFTFDQENERIFFYLKSHNLYYYIEDSETSFIRSNTDRSHPQPNFNFDKSFNFERSEYAQEYGIK